jgi:hypothetical protein
MRLARRKYLYAYPQHDAAPMQIQFNDEGRGLKASKVVG